MSAELHTLLDADPTAGLRGVAALMRARAEAATKGPRVSFRSDAPHVAGMHPAVALAVADWLDNAAHLYPFDGIPALAVARAYLGQP